MTCDSCEINYLAAGSKEDRAVVLLHGMKFQAATWQELGSLGKLADAGFYAIALDMPGFGESPACSADQDEVLHSFLTMIGKDQVILVGPSMGGRIALEYAINHPGKLGGLVLVGAVGVQENKDHLPGISIPTLLVWGGDDQISPLTNAELLDASIEKSNKIIIEGAPHPCYLDNPDKWHGALLDFLATVGG